MAATARPCLPRCFMLRCVLTRSQHSPRSRVWRVLSRSPGSSCVLIPARAHGCNGSRGGRVQGVALTRSRHSLMRARSLSRLPWRVYPPARAMATVSRAPVHSCTGHCKGSNSPRRIVSSPRVGRTTPGVCGGRVALTTPGAHSPRCAHLCTGRVALSRCGAVCNGSRLTRVVWNVPRCSPGVLQCLPRASLQRAGACTVPGVQGMALFRLTTPGAHSPVVAMLTVHPWGTLPAL